MATKKPAVSSQLKQAQERITELEKSLAWEKNSSGYYRSQQEEAAHELEQVHAFMDAMPNAIPRKKPGEYGGETKHSLMTRIAAWLSMR